MRVWLKRGGVHITNSPWQDDFYVVEYSSTEAKPISIELFKAIIKDNEL